MSSLRIRFKFNQQTGGKATFGRGGTRGVDNFARVIVEEAAFQHGERVFELVKTQIISRLRNDVERELRHMAAMFMGSVVGAPARMRGPSGTLSTVAPVSDAMSGYPQMSGYPVKGLVPSWTPRSSFYLAANRNNPWFQRDGAVLSALANPKAWTTAFGPISVSVFRHRQLSAAQGGKLKTVGHSFNFKEKISVAKIRVEALARITPDMLPAAGGGSLNDYGPNPRGNGLLSMLGERVAWRLGGNPLTVPFRPTVQPFLGYFLTRQMPNAVFKRIEQGFQNQRWSRVDGGAGRTR